MHATSGHLRFPNQYLGNLTTCYNTMLFVLVLSRLFVESLAEYKTFLPRTWLIGLLVY